MYGELWRINAPLFSFKALCYQSTKFYPYKLYISEISNHYSLSVEHIKSWNFQNFNFGLECLLIYSYVLRKYAALCHTGYAKL